MEIRRVRRKIDGDFDEKVFYRFYNSVRPNTTISAGQNQDSGGAINMTVAETYSSSENWQIYYQQGRYFIRNYDYGDYQLGVTESSRSVPRLLKRSGALGQQWSLMRDDAGGGWKMSNGLLGNGTWLSISGINTVPAMQPSGNGAVWDIQTNPSAGSPKGGDLYQDVDNFEVSHVKWYVHESFCLTDFRLLPRRRQRHPRRPPRRPHYQPRRQQRLLQRFPHRRQ